MLTGRCHCGAIAFEIDGDLPERLTRCTCSFCSKRGTLNAYYPPEAVRFSAADDADEVYRWQTRMVAHHFCRTCGCSTYSDSPAFEPDGSWDGKTRRIAVNARLLDDFEAADWPVTVIDGKNLW